MNIVHVHVKEKFTQGVVRFYGRFFGSSHTICYINYSNEPSLIDKNISINQREFYFQSKKTPFFHLIKFFRMLNKYDYIVFHSFFMLTGKSILLLLLWPGLRKKVVWVEWGGDLYEWRNKLDKGGVRIISKAKESIANLLNFQIRSRCVAVVCIFPPDCEMYHKMFPKSRAKVFYAPYCELPEEKTKERKQIDSIEKAEIIHKGKDQILIQIGQNANPSLKHIETLSLLRKYCDQNILILLPLSYAANGEYVKEVIDYANTAFPGKTIILTEMLPKEQYFDLIKKVDIAIFNTNRQAGLGNIHNLLRNNVKVYLREDGVMYQYFLDNGQPVEKISNIEKESFEQFISVPQVDEKKRDDYWKKQSSMEMKVKLWENVYEYLENK